MSSAARSGLLVVVAVVLSVSIYLWLSAAVLVPVSQSPVVFAFVAASLKSFLFIVLVVGVVVLSAHALLRTVSRRFQAVPLLSLADVSYLLPLMLLAALALELLTLLPRQTDVMSVATYVIIDLKWWWAAAVLAWTFARADRRLGGACRSTLKRLVAFGSTGIPEATLATVAAIWVIAGTPSLRFAVAPVGDEPKYLRYCENLYQGRGFEISRIAPIKRLGPDFRSRVGQNFVVLAQTVPQELRDISDDLFNVLLGRARVVGRARAEVGDFVVGKTGGLFQLHNPGLSLLMFPAYYLDRWWAPVPSSEDAQWPDKMPIVSGFLLGIYLLSTVLLYRMLRRYTESSGTAWVVTAATMLSLPVAAFPFQIYPESPAVLLLLVVARAIVFPSASWRWRWVLVGLVLGYLPWVHIRFSGVALLLLAGTCLMHRRERRTIQRLAIGFAVPAVCLMLYSYQITGSLNPLSGYFIEADADPLSVTGALRGGLGYLIDRDWGLLAHSPVYLFALPGIYWLYQRRQYSILLLELATVILILTAGAHSLIGAGTTPMRLICAGVPFAAFPIAEAFRRYGGRPLFKIAFALLLVLSLDTALAYNLHNELKIRMIDSSISGWRANLLFPAESRWPWRVSTANAVDMAIWVVIVVTLLLSPMLVAATSRGRSWSEPFATSAAKLTFTVIAILVSAGTVAGATTGVWSLTRYQILPAKGAQTAALMVDDLGQCSLCVISGRSPLSTRAMLRYLESVDRSVASRERPGEARRYAEWLAMPGQIRAWYVEANGGRQPSESDIGHYLYQWREEHVPRDEIQRRIFSAAGKPVIPK